MRVTMLMLLPNLRPLLLLAGLLCAGGLYAQDTSSTAALLDGDLTSATIDVAAVLSSGPAEIKYFVDEPVHIPPHFQEAPDLAKLVAEGKLPPVKDRLPEHPTVITPLDRIGTYGGDWRKLGSASTDLQLGFRLGYEPLVRWDRDGKKVIPGVAESWEMRDGGKTFVFHLRKGMKWSDGVPLTSADFKFTFDYILNYPGFSLFALPWMRVNNELPTVEAPDPYTVVYKFVGPYGNFPKAVAASGLQHDFFCPKHYLEQFHEKFTDPTALKKQIADAGFVTWMDYFMQRMDLDRNVELPTLSAYQIKVPYPATQCIAVRNPYYYKVDTEGNQLPYMDRMVTNMVQDGTILNLKAMNGEADFQIRKIDASNFTLFKETGRVEGYRTIAVPSTNPMCVYINQFSRNDDIRKLLQDKRFRQALAYAINRKELIDLIFSGLAVPSGGFAIPQDPYFLPGMDTANTEYNPAKANALLDELGLKRRKSDGMRVFPNGVPFYQVMNIYPSEEGTNADLWQLVSDYWREVGLQFSAKLDDGALSFLQTTTGNSDFFCYVNSGLHWDIDGVWKIPISNMSYMAPLYGNYYKTDGKQGIKPSPEMQRLIDWYEIMRGAADDGLRLQMGHNILKQWADECYVIGICRAPIVAVVSNRLQNVKQDLNYDYRLKSPGFFNPEQFFIDESAEGEK